MASTKPAVTSADQLFELASLRRSVYPLTKEIPISNQRVKEIVERAVLLAPSPFNNQANRAVILLGDEHDKFWDTTRDVLKAVVPEDSWGPTAAKMDMFKAGAGSVGLIRAPSNVPGRCITTARSSQCTFTNQLLTRVSYFPLIRFSSSTMAPS